MMRRVAGQACRFNKRWLSQAAGHPSEDLSPYLSSENRRVPYTLSLSSSSFVPSSSSPLPCFHILGLDGQVAPGAEVPETVSEQVLMEIQEKMIVHRSMDAVLYDAQRQGRISFYMSSTGEEGISVATGNALALSDPVFSQYREAGVLLARGFTPLQFTRQCFSTANDLGKGRQMPVHYGSPRLNFHFISSPLATQIPQAVGTAFGVKRENMEGKEDKRCVGVFFGEGAASEGDCHAGLNFASTLEVPCVFLCRNNGYAISTPTAEQFRGDGIASRAIGYGMNALRVDGNDPIAVYHAVTQAREFAINESKPILVEFMSYRVGHHSTSDDSTRYREREEIDTARLNCPISRLGGYLESKGLWTKEREEELLALSRTEVVNAMKKAEAEPKTKLSEMFNDVYSDLPSHILRQKEQLKDHVQKYAKEYEPVLRAKRISMDITMRD